MGLLSNTFDCVSQEVSQLALSLKSLAKVCMLSKRSTVERNPLGDKLIVLGNGPSLNDTISEFGEILVSTPTMAVNFAANAPQFALLRPRYYVLADPHFFNAVTDANVKKLWDNINGADWEMTLFLPMGVKAAALTNPKVKVERFNAVGVEGWHWLENLLFKAKLAMPRPRNVLIPSIMLGLWMGYREVYLTGADHSWLRTISVTDNNEVVSVQPHFYAEDKREQVRVNHEYRGYRLHQIIYSFYVAFSSYFAIERFAKHIGAQVYNSTPGSFIDAFPRRPLC